MANLMRARQQTLPLIGFLKERFEKGFLFVIKTGIDCDAI
jgi:hypothetical protein